MFSVKDWAVAAMALYEDIMQARFRGLLFLKKELLFSSGVKNVVPVWLLSFGGEVALVFLKVVLYDARPNPTRPLARYRIPNLKALSLPGNTYPSTVGLRPAGCPLNI